MTDVGDKKCWQKCLKIIKGEWVSQNDLPCQLGGSIDFKYERNLKMAISIDRFTKKTHHVVKKVTKVWFQINAEIFRFWKISKIFDFWNLNWAYLKWKKSIQIKLIPLKCQTMNIRRVFKKMPDRLYWGKSRTLYPKIHFSNSFDFRSCF